MEEVDESRNLREIGCFLIKKSYKNMLDGGSWSFYREMKVNENLVKQEYFMNLF